MTPRQKMFDFISQAYSRDGKGQDFGTWFRQPYNWANNGRAGRLFAGAFDQSLYDTYYNMYKQAHPGSAAASPVAQQPPAMEDLSTVFDNPFASIANDELAEQSAKYGKMYDEIDTQRNQYNDNYMSIMKRLMDREDRLGSGNPFIDMLDGYINYRKQKNPDYRWGGLISGAESGIKGLLGLFNKNKQQPQAAPFIGPLTVEQERIFGR